MGKAGQVAIGRIVLRAKEYLVALREQNGLLSLTTMHFADEIRDPQDTGAIPSGKASEPSKREIDDAIALIGELTDDFKPSRYDDCHRVRLLRLIDEKKQGGQIEIPEPEPKPQKAPADLMKALEDSLAKARSGSGGGGRRRRRSKGVPAASAPAAASHRRA